MLRFRVETPRIGSTNFELVSFRLAFPFLYFSSPSSSNGWTSGSGPTRLHLRLWFRQLGGRIVGRIVVGKQWLGLVVVEKIGYSAFRIFIGKIAFVRSDEQIGFGSWDSKAFGCMKVEWRSPDCWSDLKTSLEFGCLGRLAYWKSNLGCDSFCWREK
ncbi:hypothetical protein Tco_1556353 [Tanacetum coccineum]